MGLHRLFVTAFAGTSISTAVHDTTATLCLGQIGTTTAGTKPNTVCTTTTTQVDNHVLVMI